MFDRILKTPLILSFLKKFDVVFDVDINYFVFSEFGITTALDVKKAIGLCIFAYSLLVSACGLQI